MSSRFSYWLLFPLVWLAPGFVSTGSAPAEAAAPRMARVAPIVAVAADELPSVEAVLNAYVAALGGKEAYTRVHSRTVTGSIQIPELGTDGDFKSFALAPNKSAVIIELPGFGQIKEGFDGEVAWTQDPMMGLREKSGLELFASKLDSDFYREIHLQKLYPTMNLQGKVTVGAREAYLIEATPEQGNPEKLYFDVENGLLLRQDVEREGPQGMVPVQVHFEEYREVDDLMVPFVIRQENPQFRMTIRFSEIEHNISIDESRFRKPEPAPLPGSDLAVPADPARPRDPGR